VIYFTQTTESGPIKIGTTQDIDKRAKSLKAMLGVVPRILAVMDGGLQEERDLHRRFKGIRAPGKGRELFMPDASLLEFISTNGKPWSPKPAQTRLERLSDRSPLATRLNELSKAGVHIGGLLKANLFRLGYGDEVVSTKKIADLVTTKTGKKMSRQRVAQILNSVHIEDETIARIATAVGVSPGSLREYPE
jgi:hypothetical protein